MSKNSVLPWIAVNNYMRDEYRAIVVNIALRYLPEASQELRIFARRELSSRIKIDGFRSFDRAPAGVLQNHAVTLMRQDTSIATAIVCLWAEAESHLIAELKATAEARGLRFDPDWSWKQASKGFAPFEQIPTLAECAEALAREKPSPESDHIHLAALWLSRAMLPEPLDTVKSDLPALGGCSLSPELVTPVVAASTSMPVQEETLPELSQRLRECVAKSNEMHQLTVSQVQLALAAAESLNPAEVETCLVEAQNALKKWKSELDRLREVILQTRMRLANELETRPDLELEVSLGPITDGEMANEQAIIAPPEGLLFALEQIVAYDREKQEVLGQLEVARATAAELENDISGWVQDESVDTFLPPLPVVVGDLDVTLNEGRLMLKQALEEQHRLEDRRLQLRALSLKRIATLVERLIELGLPLATPVLGSFSLEMIRESNIGDWSSPQLWSLEQRLVGMVDEQIAQTEPTVPSDYVANLRDSWSDKVFIDLLCGLANDKRDVEVVLTLLAANAVHPRTQKIILPRAVIGSLLRGVGHLSRKTHPFELLISLALDLFSGVDAAEPESRAELCLVFLAAYYSGRQRLPEGFLWQISVEWPMSGMENWSKLWEAALLNEPLPLIASTSEVDLDSLLKQARSRAEQDLAHERGMFTRLNSLKSRRHIALLRDKIMPDLVLHLETLQALEQEFQTAEQHQVHKLIARLENTLHGELGRALQEDAIVEAYESSAGEVGIDDSDPFHRRTALRVLNDCAQSILEYGQTMLELWRSKLQHPTQITYENLQAELTMIPELTSLGRAALDQIARATEEARAEWDNETARVLADRQIVFELLTRPTYALRIPRSVGYLTSYPLDWVHLFDYLLDDLAHPLDATSAAVLLLEQEASNQALLLTQHISLDLQKQAQSLKSAKEREIEQLQGELLKLGGYTEDLAGDRELGRWRLLRKKITERLSKHQALLTQRGQQVQQRAHQLRQAINELDLSIFESKNTIPQDAYQLLEYGLGLARKATATEALFDQVEAYLQEVRYRLERDSWPLAELQMAADQLGRKMSGEVVVKDSGLNVEKVLDLLEREEVQRLGLNPSDIVSSESGTRSDLLRSWLSVSKLPTLMSENLKVADRIAIQNLFRHFAQMVSMKRQRAPDGNPIEYEYPFVYAYWRLQYPKTTVLDENCILVALPGQPPSPRDLEQLEHFMQDKDWLSYAFVLLFIPGCTPALRNRLTASYQGKSLVVIDEATILDMVLAEAEGTKPLGRLRPLMLNARGAENVDVFKVNHLVTSRTAIFVGREQLVDRIASSGDNYALYGGRRIGKSSVLAAVGDRLEYRGVRVVFHSFEGEKDASDDASAVRLAQLLNLGSEVGGVEDFKVALQRYLDGSPDISLVLLLDEVDRYIIENPKRHILIEALRTLSDRYGNRFRVVVAGFMELYDCLRGRGPYTPTSDPWRRMLNDIGALGNLKPISAEHIAREGFLEILGWKFENRAIPQRIVELTGGHPAFVQEFCMQIQQRVAKRRDRLVRLDDVKAVFDDQDPEQSFIAYVRKTLELNLDPIARYLILWLTAESSQSQGFTLDQIQDLAADVSPISIPEEKLARSLERLSVTSVVRETMPKVYEFSVPDYPLILDRLGETAHLNSLEAELKECLESGSVGI